VAAVHRQARPTLLLALGFALTAPVLAVVPHEGGTWLPLHVFLVGGVLSAISGATQLLAVTWSTAPAPPDAVVAAQRWLLAAGALGLTAVRAADGPRALAGLAGAAVLVSLIVLAWLLVRIRTTARLDRFHPAVDGYLVALGVGVGGSTLGLVLAVSRPGAHDVAVRDAHLTANLLGLVGLVVLSTLPWFLATQARTRLSPRATPVAVRAVVAVAAATVAVAAVARPAGHPGIAAAALVAHGLIVAASTLLWPALGRRQRRWAGPRLLQLVAGVAWWVAASWLFAAAAGRDEPVPVDAVLALVLGGFAQILTGSLAYFGPVLRGGDHADLTEGFATTRSWVVLVAANAAAVAALAEARAVLALAVGVWAADTAARAVVLARPGRDLTRPAAPSPEDPT
jgi:hypothetical protein